MTIATMLRQSRAAIAVLCVAVMALAEPAAAQEPMKVKLGRLGFPSLSAMFIDPLAAKKIDKKHGLDVEIVSFGAISAYYAAIATGEVDMLVGGPHVFQKMMLEGVPISIVLTWARLNALGVVTGDPAVKTINDLKGKSIAADMGSSEYQILAIYGRKQGVVFGKDITVVQANPALARTQLQAGRVEAAMMWEPTTTVTLRDNPNYRTILRGDAAWNAIATKPGWEVVLTARHDFLKRSPQAVERITKWLQEGEQLIKANPDEADEVVAGTVKLPKGVMKEAFTGGRLVFEIKPAWGAERAALEEMFKVAVDSGYLPKLPPPTAIYQP